MNDPKTIEAVANLVNGDNIYFNEYHKYLVSLKNDTISAMINAPAKELPLLQGAARMITSQLNDLASAPAKFNQAKAAMAAKPENTRNGST